MPTDEAARDYILYIANRIQHSSNGFKYSGNLTVDAKRLGLPLDKLTESLNAKNLTATTARNLFKRMVPESERQVDHWNQLKPDVLMKEKILLSMRTIFCNIVFSSSFDRACSFRFPRKILRPARSRSEKTSHQSSWMSQKSTKCSEETESADIDRSA